MSGARPHFFRIAMTCSCRFSFSPAGLATAPRSLTTADSSIPVTRLLRMSPGRPEIPRRDGLPPAPQEHGGEDEQRDYARTAVDGQDAGQMRAAPVLLVGRRVAEVDDERLD